jgi:hypothetical protein
MSDGITAARRGTYFLNEKYDNSIINWVLHQQMKNKKSKINKDFKHMPNQKWHKIISFIKSGVRIVGYAFIPFNLVVATIILIFSEVIGIIEELV